MKKIYFVHHENSGSYDSKVHGLMWNECYSTEELAKKRAIQLQKDNIEYYNKQEFLLDYNKYNYTVVALEVKDNITN